MRTKRLVAIILIVSALASFMLPINALSMLDERFNLGYSNSLGRTIIGDFYENASVAASYSKLADRALALKNGGYSYTAAIQILNETRAVLKKTTTADYDRYEEMFENGVQTSSSITYRFTYDSFIMRNVLYAMFVNDASYSQMLNAIQIIYDCAIIQSQKDAFRSDALDVLSDLKIIASYEGNKDKADMLFYVSNISSGAHSGYSEGSKLPSKDIADSYQDYLDELYDNSHYEGPVIDNTSGNNPDSNLSGGTGEVVNPYIPIQPGGTINPDITLDDDYTITDSFMNDLSNLHAGKGLDNLVLFYTVEKTNEDPTYFKTKIKTSKTVSYENIVTALLTASRNTDLIIVEDTDAVLLIHNGSCTVLAQSDKRYAVEDVAELFTALKDFGLFLGDENTTKTGK